MPISTNTPPAGSSVTSPVVYIFDYTPVTNCEPRTSTGSVLVSAFILGSLRTASTVSGSALLNSAERCTKVTDLQ